MRRAAVLLVTAGLSLAAWKAYSSLRLRRARADLSAAEQAMQRRDYAPAEGLLLRAVPALPPPERYRALCMRAEALAWLKRPEDARAALEAARKIDDASWDAHYGLARLALLDVKENCPEGLKLMEEALSRTGEAYWSKAREMPDVHRLRWRCHQQLGDVESAMAELSRELAVRYNNGETSGENVRFALMNRAWANYLLYEKYMDRLAKEGWETIYRERYRRDPAQPAEGATDPRRLAESVPYQFLAQAEFDSSTALKMQEDADLRLLHARVLISGGKAAQAAQDLAALAKSPGIESNPEYWLLRASSEGQRKDWRAALASVERSLALDGGNREAAQLRETILRLSKGGGKKRR